MGQGGFFASSLATLIMLLVLVALAPIYNTAISLILNAVDDPVAEILIKLIYPTIIIVLLYKLFVSRDESFEQTTASYFGE